MGDQSPNALLADRVAIVTGAGRGIGRAEASRLAAYGARVVVNDLGVATDGSETGETPAAEVVAEVTAHGGEAVTDGHDISTTTGGAGVVERALDTWGRLDIVVNNAGAISHIPFAQLTLAEWHHIVDTDLTSTFLVTQRALPLLSAGGSVVNVGSKVATVGIPLRAHYTAAKAGLVGLTRSLAKEYGSKGLRFNIVAPGPVQTESETPEPIKERYRTMIPLGRLGTTGDIANVVLFLASSYAAFVTGETVNVDGGL